MIKNDKLDGSSTIRTWLKYGSTTVNNNQSKLIVLIISKYSIIQLKIYISWSYYKVWY